MQQKIILIRYFCIGISVLFLLVGCGKETVEYRMTMDLTFINRTDTVLSFNLNPSAASNNLENLTILPQSQSKIFTYDLEGVDKNLDPDNCCQGVLYNLFEGGDPANFIVINENLCVTHLLEKSVDISNYDVEIISPRRFRYTYTFTKVDIENARPCK
jgi:hypothetical protein